MVTRSPTCQYGVLGVVCGDRATTRRMRPAGNVRWWVCVYHAAILDRLRENMTKHAELLDRLKDG